MENLPVDYFVTSQAFTKTTHRDVYPEIDPTSASNSQAGKVIVITGASKGVGRLGFVHSFAKANPKGLVLVARSAKALEEVAKEVREINKNIEVLAVPADLTDKNSVAALWEQVKAKFGHADVLVNNAGLMGAGPVSSAPQDEWWADFQVNVHGLFLTTQGFLSLLAPDTPATILNMTSGAAITVIPTLSSYSISKLAALQIQAFVAAENPRVTAVALHPGVVKTDMTAASFLRFALDTPALVGGTAVWIAADAGRAAFLSGRYVSANWAVGELWERRAEIEAGGKLKVALVGDFGQEQFA